MERNNAINLFSFYVHLVFLCDRAIYYRSCQINRTTFILYILISQHNIIEFHLRKKNVKNLSSLFIQVFFLFSFVKRDFKPAPKGLTAQLRLNGPDSRDEGKNFVK